MRKQPRTVKTINKKSGMIKRVRFFYLATRTLCSSYSASKPFELLPNWRKHSARLYTVH